MRKGHRATGLARRPRTELGHVRVDRHREIHLERDRKSTRLNSSHSQISYAVFCLKKKKNRENAMLQHSVYRGESSITPLSHTMPESSSLAHYRHVVLFSLLPQWQRVETSVCVASH